MLASALYDAFMVYADTLNRTIDSEDKDYRKGLDFFENIENRVYTSKKMP